MSAVAANALHALFVLLQQVLALVADGATGMTRQGELVVGVVGMVDVGNRHRGLEDR